MDAITTVAKLNTMSEAEVHELNRKLAKQIAIRMAVFAGVKIVVTVGLALVGRQLAKSLEANLPEN